MSFSADVLALSPAAYWRLDESSGTSAADSSGNSHSLTANAAPTWGGTTSGANVGGTSASGFTTSTRLQSSNGLFGTLTAVTFMAAFKTTGSAIAMLMARDQSSASADRQFQFRANASGNIELITFDASNAVTSITSASTYRDGAWHLAAGVWTGTQLRLYVDGASVATAVATTVVRTGTSSIILGGRYQGSAGSWTDPWLGSLDEVAIWTTALTAGNISDLYTSWSSSGTTGTGAATGPACVASGSGTLTVLGTGAATGPAGVASGAGTVTTTGAGAATGPAGVADGLGIIDSTVLGAGSATGPAGVADGAGTVTTTGAGSATGPVGVADGSGDVDAGATTGVGAATGPVGVAAGTGSNTTLDPWAAGAHGEALLNLTCPPGVLEITYPAEPAPAHIVEVSLQRASHQMPALTGVRAMDYDIVTDNIGTPHVWVDGVDVTYFRGIPAKIAGWRQESPFGWTSTTLTFPQVFHYEERGTGDLAWMRADAPVEIAIVTPLGDRLHRFTGQLTSDDPGTGRGRTECVWGVEGLLWQSDHAHHPVPARLDPTDIGRLIPDELNGTPARRFAPIARVATGIPERKRGSHNQTRWGYVTDLLATALDDGGNQWTLDATGPRSFALALKDAATVHWTITAGAPGVELDLSHDHHERIDAVYARGVGPDGYAWANLFFPDLLPYDPPAYLYADAGESVHLGDTDAGTLTGTGISDWQRRIRDLGYTTLAVDGVMGSADIAAVKWIQRKRGILVDGVMGPQTWAATWNIGAVGGDLSTVRLPMAVRAEVEPFLYGANGAVVGDNPDYDPSIIRHEIDVDLGAGVTKEQGREMAQRILERGTDPGIVGTLVLTTCPWEGSRWEMNAGENVLIKGFRGEDILCRIVALDADPEAMTVKLTVDSEHRDAMAVLQVLDRNRESKADPARRPGNPNRRSRLDQDQVTPFEGESPAGRLPRLPLREGLWTVWPVPVSEVGIIAKLRFVTSGPASRFAAHLFGKPVTANQLAAKVPDPLATTNPMEAAGESWLNSVGWIEGWGEQGDAAGYGMLGRESAGSPVTGELYDDAGVPYVSQVSPWVWVALYSPTSCFIEGRIYPDVTQ